MDQPTYTWTPSALPGSGRNDVTMNEFIAAVMADFPNTEIEDRDWPAYLTWADCVQTATLVDADCYQATVDLRLTEPWNGLYTVRYPWDAVRSVPGLMDAVDLLLRGREPDGCYGYDMACRCPRCMVQDDHETSHFSPTEGCIWCATTPTPLTPVEVTVPR